MEQSYNKNECFLSISDCVESRQINYGSDNLFELVGINYGFKETVKRKNKVFDM